MFPTSLDNSSSDILTQLRAALRDPAQAQALRLALQDPNKAQALRNALAAAGGPASLQNTLQAASAAASKAGSNSPIGSLVGALTGAGVNLLRRRGKAGTTQSTADADRGTGATDTYEPNLAAPAGGGSAAVQPDAAAAATIAGANTAGPATPGTLVMGLDRYGNPIHSNDGGRTWTSDSSGGPVAGPAYNAQTIGTVGGGGGGLGSLLGGDSGGEFGGAAGADTSQLASVMSPGDFGGEYARGGRVKAPPKKAILLRRPGGAKRLAIPVISTTIVIARKPDKKAEKRARGGTVKPVEAAPKAPRKQGAEREPPPQPFKKGGHVQVPRGSGIAQRGKRFRGIF